MAAYRSALALQVDMIEMDVHMTRDGERVCMHDHRVDRTTNGDGLVREMTLEEIRALDAGRWKDKSFAGEKVPLFTEFLDLMRQQPVVEKKHFDRVRAYGVEPWVYYREEDEAVYDMAILNGARLFTANDPAWALAYLRSKNLHQ